MICGSDDWTTMNFHCNTDIIHIYVSWGNFAHYATRQPNEQSTMCGTMLKTMPIQLEHNIMAYAFCLWHSSQNAFDAE